MLVLGLLLLNGALLAECQAVGPKVAGSLENVTVHVIDSKTVQVFWTTNWKNVERYDITYNPAEDRVVTQAAGNSNSVVLRELRPNTRYQVTVSAVINGRNYKSRRLIFKTGNGTGHVDLETVDSGLEPTKPTRGGKWRSSTAEVVNPDPTAVGSKYTPPTSTTVRGVEIGLVLLALVVWVIAISLFFHRWGKIRMLLPYQPDYKTQQSLKVPGTGTTSSSGRTGNGGAQAQHEGAGCVQHLRWSLRHIDERSAATKFPPSTKWSSRSRVSSAIFPASPSFYGRTSLEGDSGRGVRQVYSHNDLSAEAIPLCRVTEAARGGGPGRKPLNDPAFPPWPRKNFLLDNEPCASATETMDSSFVVKKDYLTVHRLASDAWEGTEGEREPLFFVEVGSSRLRDPGEEAQRDDHRPLDATTTKRYTRSSFKKQKMRYCEDYEPETENTVPILEPRTPVQVEPMPRNLCPTRDKLDDPKEDKTAEIERKKFLRKVSLQETHLNYNQDYWLDRRKSGKFHKSIDLGYLGNEIAVQEPARKRGLTGSRWTDPPPDIALRGGFSPVKWPQEEAARCDSDPLLFSSDRATPPFEINSSELLTEVINRCRAKGTATGSGPGSWFLANSTDNIPLFSDRNGLIETEFDVLDERPGEVAYEAAEVDHKHFVTLPFDLSTFYEVKLRESGQESDEEVASASEGFDCVRLPATSPSDEWRAFNETEPPASFRYPVDACSSGFTQSTCK